MVEGYKCQDDKAKRDSKNNVFDKDHKAMKNKFENDVCISIINISVLDLMMFILLLLWIDKIINQVIV
jgi:hypothetical protein